MGWNSTTKQLSNRVLIQHQWSLRFGWVDQLSAGTLAFAFFFGSWTDQDFWPGKKRWRNTRYGPTKKGTWIGWIEYMIQDISIHTGPPYFPIHFTLFSNHRKTGNVAPFFSTEERPNPLRMGSSSRWTSLWRPWPARGVLELGDSAGFRCGWALT